MASIVVDILPTNRIISIFLHRFPSPSDPEVLLDRYHGGIHQFPAVEGRRAMTTAFLGVCGSSTCFNCKLDLIPGDLEGEDSVMYSTGSVA